MFYLPTRPTLIFQGVGVSLSLAQRESYIILDDYDITGYGEYFKLLLKGFIRKYNLRYRLDDPFLLRFLLPGSFTNLYLELPSHEHDKYSS